MKFQVQRIFADGVIFIIGRSFVYLSPIETMAHSFGVMSFGIMTHSAFCHLCCANAVWDNVVWDYVVWYTVVYR